MTPSTLSTTSRAYSPGGGRLGTGLDRAGVTVSFLCALHCAMIPMLAAALPMIGLGLLAHEGTEAALMGASAALGAVGLGLGFRRHGSGRALAVLAIGLCLLALGRLAESRDAEVFGLLAVVAGGLTIAGAHLLNRRLCRMCPPCNGGGSTGACATASPAPHADGGADAGEGRP